MRLTVATLGATLLTASCAMGPVRVEEDFGRSVRQMVDAQISDPAVAADPSRHAPDRLDGAAAEEALSGYREGGRRDRDGAGDEIRLSID